RVQTRLLQAQEEYDIGTLLRCLEVLQSRYEVDVELEHSDAFRLLKQLQSADLVRQKLELTRAALQKRLAALVPFDYNFERLRKTFEEDGRRRGANTTGEHNHVQFASTTPPPSEILSSILSSSGTGSHFAVVSSPAASSPIRDPIPEVLGYHIDLDTTTNIAIDRTRTLLEKLQEKHAAKDTETSTTSEVLATR
ncbi:unnamed protein product, partial [Amoebophrya sp. A25]